MQFDYISIMDVKIRLWLTDEAGEGFLGEGRYRLLCAIGRLGSLQRAARELGISYRKAWGDIQSVERHVGFAVLKRQRGGRSGGESSLTEQAKWLLESYSKIQTEAEKMVRRRWQTRLKQLAGEKDAESGEKSGQ
jgi:molybdate transport system regulatory protein